MLQTANELRTRLPRPPPPWDIDLVGVRDALARTGAGLVVEPTSAHVCGASLPGVLVPGITHKQPEPLLKRTQAKGQQPARDLLLRYRAEDVPVAAACTATFLLAEGGILNDLDATPTPSWWLAPWFSAPLP
ncbi:hypothetical protein [Streptomyces cyanogenus]|uniref:HTH-type transcriptional regulator CdhR n=1 Tax=Streptomyces cyanogenus TaxID=80860 RepID=A0ABX7TKW3_STRCY|nr:hypothetical protein [Streptomyces cyanogenus]QTD96015.1 HTH-type transcriptional regulator CdhR [Streptomyces cyanogenus]